MHPILLFAVITCLSVGPTWSRGNHRVKQTESGPDNGRSEPPRAGSTSSPAVPGDYDRQAPQDADLEGDSQETGNGLGQDGGTDEQTEDAPKEAPSKPMSLNVAKMNLTTLVETYVTQYSPDGFFPLKDKSGKLWHLQLDMIQEKTLKRLGPNRYTACASMHELKQETHDLDVDFTGNFSGPKWRVTDVLIHKVDGKPRFIYDRNNRRIPAPSVSKANLGKKTMKKKDEMADP